MSDAVALRPPPAQPARAGAPDRPAGPGRPAFFDRRLAAFIFMVFGMFMAILDIQIVSASLSQIQAGLSASSDEITWVQTSYLIAEVIMIPLSGLLSRMHLDAGHLHHLGRRLHRDELMCATADHDRRDDRLAGAAGLHRRRHDPDGVRLGLHDLPALEAAAIVSPIIGLVATLAPTIGPTVGGYLTDWFSWHWLFLVNVGPGIIVTVAAWLLIDFDKPDWSLLTKFDWSGPARHGRLSRRARICARGRAVEGLVRKRSR